jgi:hypothetical protein
MKWHNIALFLLAVLLLFANSAKAQNLGPQTNTSATAGIRSNLPIYTTNVQVSAETLLREDIQDLTARVLKVEVEDVKLSKLSEQNATTPAIIAGFSVAVSALIAGALTFFGQWYTAERERVRAIVAARQQFRLVQRQIVLQQSEKILEFKIRQLENFYAPMFALFQQSTALYHKMLDQLAQDEPGKYKLRDKPDDEGFWMYILAKDGKLKPFRLLDQLPDIKKHPKAYELITRIIGIGKRTTEIISKHSGLASADLIDLLGEYLAHVALLSAVDQGSETEAFEPLSQKTGYFSHELIAKIKVGYHELSKFIDSYAAAGKTMLTEFAQEPQSGPIK